VKKAREALAACTEITEITSNLERVPVYMQGIKATETMLSVIPRKSSLALHAEEPLYAVISTVHKVLVEKHLVGAGETYAYEPFMPVFNAALAPDEEPALDFTQLNYDRMGVSTIDLGRLHFDTIELVEMDTKANKAVAELELRTTAAQRLVNGDNAHHLPFDHHRYCTLCTIPYALYS
jgi:hypothetical protein